MTAPASDASELYLGPDNASHVPEIMRPKRKELARARLLFSLATAIPFAGAVAAVASASVLPPSRVDGVVTLVLFVLTFSGIEVGYHRLFSHHAFRAHAAVRVGLAVLGAMAGQGPVMYWVSHHRRHHQYADKPGDPHSPWLSGKGIAGRLRGLAHAHMGWFFGSERASPGRYARDILRDRTLLAVDRNYFVWLIGGTLLPAAIGWLTSGRVEGAVTGWLWGGLLRLVLVQQMVYSVNSICHVWGSQPFDSGDSSRNSLWLMLPSLGGSLHNAHHAFPSTAKNSLRWWEIDLSWTCIRLLEILGLVTDVRVPTAEAIRKKAARAEVGVGPGGDDPRQAAEPGLSSSIRGGEGARTPEKTG